MLHAYIFEIHIETQPKYSYRNEIKEIEMGSKNRGRPQSYESIVMNSFFIYLKLLYATFIPVMERYLEIFRTLKKGTNVFIK